MPYDPHDQLENYVRERLVGRGGSSKVYLARCTRGRLHGRRVALKMIPLTALPTSSHLNHHLSSTTIHTRLHHPSIVSLLATFNTADEYCQVLELCSTTLSSFMTSRNPRSLTESEARGVFKAVVDALVYLAPEHILHRDIKADNILLTEDGRIKLGDFGLAVKLEPPMFEVSTFCGTPNYLSPEAVRRRPYGATSDIWALGCLMITILTGQPPFQGNTVEDTFRRVRRADYSLPESLSYEAKDLIRGLLQIKPEHRTRVHRILSHPFFDPSLAISPLSPNLGKDAQSNKVLRPRVSLSVVANKENVAPTRRVPRRAASVRFTDGLTEGALRAPERATLMPPYTNHNLGDAPKMKPRTSSALDRAFPIEPPIGKLQPAASATPPAEKCAASSDKAAPLTPSHKARLPLPAPLVYTQKLKSRQIDREFLVRKELPAPIPQSNTIDSLVSDSRRRKAASGVASGVSKAIRLADSPNAPPRRQPPAPTVLEWPGYRSPPARAEALVRAPSITLASPSNFSDIPTAGGMVEEDLGSPTEEYRFRLPPPLAVSGVPAGVHNFRHGNVEFLPRSRGLRLDLRTSERKAGRAGDEILQISADGERIEIIHAPDLNKSYPFTKPVLKYHRTSLPSEYWKRYRFATRFVDMARSRMPKFIVYTPTAKCTLMSNAPNADIELHLPVPLKVLSDLTEPAMRVRLSTRNQTVEISRFELVARKKGRAKVHFDTKQEPQSAARRLGEWNKKVLRLPPDGRLVSLLQTESLPEDERQAILHLEECRVVCEKLEVLVRPSGTSAAGDGEARCNPDRASQSDTKAGPARSLWEAYASEHDVDEANSSCVLREGTWEDVLRSMENSAAHTTPAGPTIAPFTTQSPFSGGRERSSTVRPSQRNVEARSVGAKSRATLNRPAADSPLFRGAFQSASGWTAPSAPHAGTPSVSHSQDAEKRFIPNLGWCIKRADSVDGIENEDVNYSVMFLDGTSLDVDARRRFAQFTDRHGKASARVPLTGHVPRRIQVRLAVFDEFRQLFDSDGPTR